MAFPIVAQYAGKPCDSSVMNHNVSSVILFQTCGTERSSTNDTRVSDGNPSMWPPSESSPRSLPFCLSFNWTAARTLLIQNCRQVGQIATRSDSTRRVKHLRSTVIKQGGVQQVENKETDIFVRSTRARVFGKALSISEDAASSVSRCYI